VFEELLKRLAIALDRAALPYMVFGGQAVLLYGEPRLTRDIDITLGVAPDRADAVLRVIGELQLQVLVADARQFLNETLVLPALDPASNIRIDFVFSLTEYERQAIARSNIVQLGGVAVRFVTLEDLVVMKVIAGRPRDLEDVAAVLRKNPGFDRQHVERWLQNFDAELEGEFLPAFEQVLGRLEGEGHKR
jgi:hypothetical protein